MIGTVASDLAVYRNFEFKFSSFVPRHRCIRCSLHGRAAAILSIATAGTGNKLGTELQKSDGLFWNRLSIIYSVHRDLFLFFLYARIVFGDSGGGNRQRSCIRVDLVVSCDYFGMIIALSNQKSGGGL